MLSDIISSTCNQCELRIRSTDEMAKSMVEPYSVVGTLGSLIMAEWMSVNWSLRVVPASIVLCLQGVW